MREEAGQREFSTESGRPNALDKDDLVVLVDTVLVDPVRVKPVPSALLFPPTPQPFQRPVCPLTLGGFRIVVQLAPRQSPSILAGTSSG